MQAFNSELFMTTSEVADLLGVHSSTVKRWTDAEELDPHKTEGATGASTFRPCWNSPEPGGGDVPRRLPALRIACMAGGSGRDSP
jgi:excisionase family DNA binding protein